MNFKSFNLLGTSLIYQSLNNIKEQYKSNIRVIDQGIDYIQQAQQKYLELNPNVQKNANINFFASIYKARKIRYIVQSQHQNQRKQEVQELLNDILKDDSELKQEINMNFLDYDNFKKKILLEHYLCVITFDIMEEPVILESGFSYEKNIIQQHFLKNGNFDPLTRDIVDPKNIIINYSLIQAIEQYKIDNPYWYDYENDDLQSIQL